MKKLITATLVATSSLIFGCSSPETSVQTPPQQLLQATLIPSSQWTHAERVSNKSLTAAYDENHRLIAKFPNMQEEAIAPRDGSDFAAGLGAAVSDTRSAILWYEKNPRKAQLYFAGSERAENIDSSESTYPLPLMGLSFLPDNRWQALWVGERPIDGKTQQNVYARLENLETQRVIQSDLLRWFQLKDGTTVVIGRENNNNASKIMFAARANTQDQFSEPKIIVENATLGPFFKAWNTGKLWVVAWDENSRSGNAGNFIRIAFSSDNGTTWGTKSFPANPGEIWYDIDVVANDTGDKIIAFASGIDRANSTLPSLLAYYTSDDSGTTWTKATNPRSDVYAYSRTRNGKLIQSSNRVYMIWEDWRSLRPEIYGGYSEDFGTTWAISDAKLNGQGDGSRFGLQVLERLDLHEGEKTFFIANRFTDDTFTKYQLYKLSLGNGFTKTEPADFLKKTEGNRNKLEARILDYWGTMASKDWAKAYTFLDPYARAYIPLNMYVSRRGPIDYSNPSIQSISVKGVIATVKTEIDVATQVAHMPGKVINPPQPHRMTVNQKWIWIDGEWYYEYYEEFSGIRLAGYLNN